MSIYKGYESFIELQVEGLSTDPAASYVSQVRDIRNHYVYGSLSTAEGTISTPEEGVLRFRFSEELTSSLPENIIFDVVRVDVTPNRHLGFTVAAEVKLPVTRGL